MEEVKAYKSFDGKLFEDLEVLKEYELRKKNSLKQKELHAFIKNHIQKGYYQQKGIYKAILENKDTLIKILKQF